MNPSRSANAKTEKPKREGVSRRQKSAGDHPNPIPFLDNPMNLAGIINSAMDAIITIDADQKVVLFNFTAEKMFGYSASEAIGQPIDMLIPARYRLEHRTYVRQFGELHQTRRSMGALGAVFGLRANGEEFPIEASISFINSGKQNYYTVIIRDISRRLTIEDQLREKAELLDHARDAIIVTDLSQSVLFWNKSAERLYGWKASEALGRDVRELIFRNNSLEFDKAQVALREAGDWFGELRQSTHTNKELIVEGHWTLVKDEDDMPKSILAIYTDISDKKRLEAQFLRAQRMESIGTLAGGIVHDLNNLLSPILMAIQLLQMRFTDDDTQRLLKTLRINAERGGELIKQVLSFARGVDGERIPLQPKHLIREIVKVLKDTLPKAIEIVFLMPESQDLWSIKGDATQIHQVLMNLCVNARDAMPEGGRITITLENRVIDENYARMQLEAKPGRYVVITVSDTGAGIPSQIIGRIFEPFFTTKEHGKGTGLGLSTVLAIVKSHGGFVDVYSEIGKGTKFRLSFPALEMGQLQEAEDSTDHLPFGNGETILVVDDEEGIREITRSTLQAFGYGVITASDGAEAIAFYAQNRNKIDVVLTDMMMPIMDGLATIRALQKINPEVRIIASSGLTENQKMLEATQAGVKTFLTKPYTAEKLPTTLAEILRIP